MNNLEPAGQDPDTFLNILKGYKGIKAFDIGANQGTTTKILAANFAYVSAFEPCVESFDILKELRNERVECYNFAVSDTNSDIELLVMENPFKSGQLVSEVTHDWGKKIGTRAVKSRTLDYLYAWLGVPDLVKIDTEGHELRIIQGAGKLLSFYSPRLYIEVHDEKIGEKLRGILEYYHYNFQLLRHPGYSPDMWQYANHYFIIAEAK